MLNFWLLNTAAGFKFSHSFTLSLHTQMYQITNGLSPENNRPHMTDLQSDYCELNILLQMSGLSTEYPARNFRSTVACLLNILSEHSGLQQAFF